MSEVTEVQLERLDGKLEKHIGITETILRNQQATLEEIRDIVKEHSTKFVSHTEVRLMEVATLAEAGDEVDEKLNGFENRIDKKLKVVGTIVVATIGILFSFIELIPLIKGGG